MSKRGADKYITDQNWDEDEDAEEAGVFKQANQDVLKKREIRKAKRRGTGDSGGNTGGTNIFKGFAGFGGSFGGASSTSSGFGGLGSKPLLGLSNPLGGVSSLGTKPLPGLSTTPLGAASTEGLGVTPLGGGAKAGEGFSFKPLSAPATKPETRDSEGKSAPASSLPSLTNGDHPAGAKKPTATPSPIKSPSSASPSKYLNQLKALNEGVARWIETHVNRNPYCILSPIFKDYEKHLESIEKKYPAPEGEGRGAVTKVAEDTTTDTTPKPSLFSAIAKPADNTISASGGFKFGSTTTTASESTPAPVFKFSTSSAGGATSSSPSVFGNISTTSSNTATGLFSTTSSTSSSLGGFSFATTKPGGAAGGPATTGFSFATGTSTSADARPTPQQGDEEYVPPKPDVEEVTEEDALYTKRCKLFFKKGDQWKEKGVGNLHLKPCGDKTQLLIRADTSLGNILLNISLQASLPMSRQGKNNVTLACIPNPPLDEKNPDTTTVVPMLIRVKTGEVADELFEKLQEHKGK